MLPSTTSDGKALPGYVSITNATLLSDLEAERLDIALCTTTLYGISGVNCAVIGCDLSLRTGTAIRV